MKVTGSSIEQCEKGKPKGKCRKWRLWASTSEGRKSKRLTCTYTQAQDAMRAWVSELEGQVPNAETFGAYAESWRLWREKSGRYSPNTLSEDARKVRALRRTALDGMRMDGITPEACREALLWLRENPVRGGAYSNTSMVKFHQALSDVLAQAADDGRLASNPMASVAAPKPDTRERDALSPDELALFLNRLDAMPLDGHVMAVYLIACLGLRRGEACALLDADVSGGLVRVRGTVRAADNTIGPTKTQTGARVLPCPPRLREKVGLWRMEKAASKWGCPELCCNSRGRRLASGVLGSWWERNRDSLGCGGMVLHQLRHSNLSMMARHMNAFDLKSYAGWSTIAPARIYVHDDFDSLARAVEMAWR